jgi:hypothetical protein
MKCYLSRKVIDPESDLLTTCYEILFKQGIKTYEFNMSFSVSNNLEQQLLEGKSNITTQEQHEVKTRQV